MNRLILSYRPGAEHHLVWPVDARWRFLIYLVLGIAAWLLPPWGALAAGVATVILGRREA